MTKLNIQCYWHNITEDYNYTQQRIFTQAYMKTQKEETITHTEAADQYVQQNKY